MCGVPNPADMIDKVMDSGGKAADTVMQPVGATAQAVLDDSGLGNAMSRVLPYVVSYYLGAGAVGAAGGAAGGTAGAVADGTSDIGLGTGSAGTASTVGTASGGTATSATGLTTNANAYLADAGTATTDVTPGISTTASPEVPAAPSAPSAVPSQFVGDVPLAADMPAVNSGETGAFDMSGSAAQPGSSSTIFDSAPPQGLIGNAIDWAKANPLLTAGALQVGGGAVQGVANRSAAKEIQERKIQADREAAIAKLQNQRDFVQSGSFYGANVPIRPGANSVLRRPDGTPVYSSPGLVASAMK